MAKKAEWLVLSVDGPCDASFGFGKAVVQSVYLSSVSGCAEGSGKQQVVASIGVYSSLALCVVRSTPALANSKRRRCFLRPSSHFQRPTLPKLFFFKF